MGEKHKMTVAQAADSLGCSKSNVQRLIMKNRLDAELQEAPVKYYLINPASVEQYRDTPKNKGGRPSKKKTM
jgi:excisionase family DNA binding protein